MTDATAGAAGVTGSYQLGDIEIEIADGGVPLREDGVFAGTVLTMIDAVRNLHALGISFEDAVGAATAVPARILGRADLGVLEPGGLPTSSCSTTGSRSSACCAGARPVSWLESELREQPAALARLLDAQAARAREIAGVFGREDVRYVVIASRGSSSNAARYAQYLLGRAHRVPVMFATPSLYTIYEQPPRLYGCRRDRHLAVGRVARRRVGARRGAPAGPADGRVTNVVDSPLAREADSVLPLEAGEERAVAATKTYLNSLGAIAILFAASDGPVAESELEQMPDVLARQIALSLDTVPVARRVRGLGRRDGGRARRELRDRVRDRVEDPRALGPRRRGVFAGRPDARADRGDP